MTKKKPTGTGIKTISPVRPVAAVKTAGDNEPSPIDLQLKTYEEAIKLFSQRSLAEACDRFKQAASGPARDIADKARSYIQVCERRLAATAPQLQTAEEHYNYGVERLNARDVERAQQHLRQALSMQPDAEHVLYIMALCCGLAGDGTGAYENLKRAIDLEPRNRILARQDPDFSALAQQFSSVRALLLGNSGAN